MPLGTPLGMVFVEDTFVSLAGHKHKLPSLLLRICAPTASLGGAGEGLSATCPGLGRWLAGQQCIKSSLLGAIRPSIRLSPSDAPHP